MFFASALGSFCVEDIGPKRLLGITKHDLARRIEQFAALVDHGEKLVFAD
jgi:hypothetical protein